MSNDNSYRALEKATFSDEPFFREYGVNIDDYQGIDITQEMLSTRAFNCLMRAGIVTFSKLLGMSEKTLSEVRSLGKVTYSEILQMLDSIVCEDEKATISIHESIASQDFEIKEKKHSKTSDIEELHNESSPLETSKSIRTSILNAILSASNACPKIDDNTEECISFDLKIEDWTKQLLKQIPNLDDRTQKLLILRLINNKTYEQAGRPFFLSKERVRQLIKQAHLEIMARVQTVPDDNTIDLLENLKTIIADASPDQLKQYLHYSLTKHNRMWKFLFSFIIPTSEQTKLNEKLLEKPEDVLKKESQKRQEEELFPPIKTGRRCPRCGSELVVRVATKGAFSRIPFIGCSTYPLCRYREQLSLKEGEALKVYRAIR